MHVYFANLHLRKRMARVGMNTDAVEVIRVHATEGVD
jgi:hypothetical protein